MFHMRLKLFGSCSKTAFFENSQEIAKVTKLCPVVHATSSRNATVLDAPQTASFLNGHKAEQELQQERRVVAKTTS